MQIFLAGNTIFPVYVAPILYQGGGFNNVSNEVLNHKPYILESFYYADETTEKLIPYFGDFLLDSGAFTVRENIKSENINWNEYVEKYADFINRNNIKKFFELDIDNLIGYENVIQLRSKLERMTNKQCIPVWHPSRGKNEFIRSTKEYDYVALGGIVGAKSQDAQYKKYQSAFPWFINTAHQNKAKIHGLGFTSLSGIKKYHFDSVDSTSWTTGNRFGFVYKFDGTTMQKIDAGKNRRLADSRKVAFINYSEWIKFQIYADKHM